MAGQRVAVITSGSSGIGEATSRRLAKDGCAIAIVNRRVGSDYRVKFTAPVGAPGIWG
jgi:NAD(P)-dependent dehydrogenase (short-subunit alcohol dehydrogenase family)